MEIIERLSRHSRWRRGLDAWHADAAPSDAETGELLDAARAEIERLRGALQRIVEHHEQQRAAWSDECGDADNADYHEDRRDFALMHLTGGKP